MDQRRLLHHAARCFNDLGIRYFVTGSMASFLYGEPRLTQDIDIVADIQEGHIPALLRSFPQTEFYIDESSIRRAVLAKSLFNIIHPSSGNKIDIIIPIYIRLPRISSSASSSSTGKAVWRNI